MIFDDADSRITDALAGRTIDHVIRNGKELEIVTMCGHSVVIQADTDGDIQFKRQDVKVILPRISVEAIAGAL